MGRVMADYAAGSAESDHGSRSRSRPARIRCDDADEEDRHRCNRGGTPRLINVFDDEAVGPNQPLQLPTCHVGSSWHMTQPRRSGHSSPFAGPIDVDASVASEVRPAVAESEVKLGN